MESMRVLIVDDEEELVNALVERLNLRGIDALGVTNGHEALERIYHESFDVVLLDVRMPGLGGLEVIKKVKEKWPKLQVVLLTGHGSTRDSEEGMRAGAFKYVMKPVNIDDLVDILRDASASAQETSE
jgi:DNA-binding NtrC family response regulator